jgi:hypothetical protein
MKMPISPEAHGLIDYGLVAALLVLPSRLKLNHRAVKLYKALGSGLGAYNAVTDNGNSLLPVIPFEKHYRIDYFNLAAIGLLTAAGPIRRDKRARIFHALFLLAAAATVVLTDKDARPAKDWRSDES